jgi:60S ribosome subunit biogenesis protein NIP7
MLDFFIGMPAIQRASLKKKIINSGEVKMRALTEDELRTVLKKLANYAGPSLKDLLAPLDDSSKADRYVFRLSKSRVYYVRLSLANLATAVARNNLLSCGTCLGKNPSLETSKMR